METTIQDDALLLHRPDAQVRQSARTMAELGADRVRITAGWSALAPDPRSKEKPGGKFDAADSRTYPQDGWHALDRAVTAVAAAGMKVQLDVAFWAPRWAVAKGRGAKDRQRWLPDGKEFGLFAHAVADRYSGSHKEGSATLPAVRMYTTWNEPNEPSFLQPQWKKAGKGRFRPFSPHVYRGMHNAAYDAIKSVSRFDTVLVGGTSAKGSDVPGVGAVPPLVFLRELTCTGPNLEPLTVPECRHYEPLKADGYAHHPYSLDTAPGTSDPNPDHAPIANVDRVTQLLSDLYKHGRLAQELPLYLTEYGYETSPPDPIFGKITPDQQASYLGWATWLAYRQPQARMFGQFLLRDIDPDESGFPATSKRHWRDWQTGLLFADGVPKPAAQAFKIPFHAQLIARQTTGSDGSPAEAPALLLFGGVRPGTGRQLVRVEREDPATGAWQPIRTARRGCEDASPEFWTDSDGFFVHTADWNGPGRYRLGWNQSNGQDNHWEYGAVIDVSADTPVVIGPA